MLVCRIRNGAASDIALAESDWVADIEAQVRELRDELVELRELYVSSLQLPTDEDFTDEESTSPDTGLVGQVSCLLSVVSPEPKTTDYCVECGHSPDSGVHLFNHNYVPKEKAPAPVKKQRPGHLAGCIGGYSCEASCS